MSYEDRSIIDKELKSDESLLWSGKPRQGIQLHSSDAFLIPFSLLWGGFAFFWEYSVWKSGGPSFFLLFGIPFVLVGIYFIIGRFFYDATVRKNTFYGVTSERVIIVSGYFQRKVRSINVKSLDEISISEKRDHSGTITLGQTPPFYAWMQTGWPGMGKQAVPQLEMIPNARSVYNLIVDLQG